jgi:hypothetical protein
MRNTSVQTGPHAVENWSYETEAQQFGSNNSKLLMMLQDDLTVDITNTTYKYKYKPMLCCYLH